MTALGLVLLLVVGVFVYHGYSMAQDSPGPQDHSSIASSFGILNQAHTDVCAFLGDQRANTNFINSLEDDYYLQGACCNPMVYSHYSSQIQGLRNYSGISIIPRDPYNVSGSQAKQLISFDAITLTPDQQSVYDNALKTSPEGPCCCQCWAWYAHEGLAKALISRNGWNVQQIVDIWGLEDCCGG